MADRAQVQLVRDLQRAERADLVALLLSLEAADWARPTPCTHWTVADVAAHVLAWEHLLAGPTIPVRSIRTVRLLLLAASSRFNVDRLNDRLRRRSPTDPDVIITRLSAPDVGRWKWRFDRLSPGAQLAEYVIHHEDVRTAIGRPRDIPQERLSFAVDGVRRLPGVRSRSRPSQPDLTGRDLLLHLAGR
ncbi:MAG: maleylpyruvate isomerase family mycothiol-dependent enzyme [Microthrixaceae bacterium]